MIFEVVRSFFERIFQSQRLGGMRRSSEWRRVRREHIKKHPQCIVTGDTRRVEVHHVCPFHIHPEGELDPGNLETLRRDMHHLFGHLRNWRSWNKTVREDAAIWREKIKNRP